MARFKFRLEKVLEVKEIAIKQEQRRLSEINEKRQKLLDNRHQLEGLLEECTTKINEMEETEANLISSYYTYLHQIMQEIRQVEEQLFHLDEEEIRVRNKLKEIQKEKKALENLKEKKYARFVQEEQRREQALLDEFALLGGLPD